MESWHAAVENTAEVTQETVQEEIEQVTEENAKELDNKKYVVDHLLSTKREGMEDLIAYMEEIGFFEAPCSGGNHLAWRVAALGARWSDGLNAGAFYWSLDNASSNRYRSIGGRLVYRKKVAA